jgi:hypothetical protein
MRLIGGNGWVDESCDNMDIEFDELADTIAKIAVGDRYAINYLIGLLERRWLDDWDIAQIKKYFQRLYQMTMELLN